VVPNFYGLNLPVILYCYTDQADNNWLSYILSQFCYAQSARFRFEIKPFEFPLALKRDELAIFYLGQIPDGFNPKCVVIPRQESYQTDDYRWYDLSQFVPNENRFTGQKIPIFRQSEKAGGTIPFDLLYNAFVHLSRLEEWELEKAGKWIGSYAFRHKRKELRVYKIPVVNYLFLMLEHFISQHFQRELFEPKHRFEIQFSHDVDYIEKTIPLRLKQSAFYLFNSLRKCVKPELKNASLFLHKAAKFGLSRADYWQFEVWQELERKANIRSIFYVYAKTVSTGLKTRSKRWLLDPAYDIEKNAKLATKLKELLDGGWEIGLHGSFDSYKHFELMKREKEVLESVIGQPVKKARQHWLRFTEDTLRIQEAIGIEEDSTLGFNELPGFRSGIASAYYPYDFEQQCAFKIKEVPLVLMDSMLFDYSATDEPDFSLVSDILNQVVDFSGNVSIDWHQRVSASDYNWHGAYFQMSRVQNEREEE
jgi:peptidoglycan/xylan/chitin deacetylase (PgdA/CDA1 family)